jgi:hypothetical protein
MRRELQVRCNTAHEVVGSRATVSFTGWDRVYFKMQVLSDEVLGIFFGLTSAESGEATSQKASGAGRCV